MRECLRKRRGGRQVGARLRGGDGSLLPRRGAADPFRAHIRPGRSGRRGTASLPASTRWWSSRGPGTGATGSWSARTRAQEDRELAARRIEAEPENWVAQETVMLSRHPTVDGNALSPRHVDLRAFAVSVDGPRRGGRRGPDPVRARSRGARGEQLPERRREGHLGPVVSARPLIGVTTSEMRVAKNVQPTPQGEPPQQEMALGLAYLRAVEAAGGLPLVIPPMPAGAIKPLIDRLHGICLSGGPGSRSEHLRRAAARAARSHGAGARPLRAGAGPGGLRRGTCRSSRSAAGCSCST